MKPLDYILKHYQESENEGAGSVLMSLVFALNHEELRTLQRKIIQCGRYRYCFSNELYKQADFVLERKNESISSLSTTMPVFESNISGLPPVQNVTTGVPHANASIFTVGKLSSRVGFTKTSLAVYHCANSSLF